MIKFVIRGPRQEILVEFHFGQYRQITFEVNKNYVWLWDFLPSSKDMPSTLHAYHIRVGRISFNTTLKWWQHMWMSPSVSYTWKKKVLKHNGRHTKVQVQCNMTSVIDILVLIQQEYFIYPKNSFCPGQRTETGHILSSTQTVPHVHIHPRSLF